MPKPETLNQIAEELTKQVDFNTAVIILTNTFGGKAVIEWLQWRSKEQE